MDDEDSEEETEEPEDAHEVDDEPGDKEGAGLPAEHGQDEPDVDRDGHGVGADQTRQLPNAKVGGVGRKLVGLDGLRQNPFFCFRKISRQQLGLRRRTSMKKKALKSQQIPGLFLLFSKLRDE